MLNNIYKKLQYRCWHRGTKEMDILLGQFFDENFLSLSDTELLDLEKFVISLSDDNLYNCFMKKKEWPVMISSRLLNRLIMYSKNIGIKDSK